MTKVFNRVRPIKLRTLNRFTAILSRRMQLRSPSYAGALRAMKGRHRARLKNAREKEISTTRKQEEFESYLANGPAADAWNEFTLNGTPSSLAQYFRLGGELEAPVRAALITLLQELHGGNPGGERPWRDLKTYNEIEMILFKDRIARYYKYINVEGKPLSKRRAIQAYAAETNQELRTVEKQYNRGKNIREKFTNETA